VVQQYVSVRTQRRLPGRRARLVDCPLWRRGSVCHRHGLRRLW
jgi:hypothetical protein